MKIVSLFSGTGGLDLGLKQARNKIVWANDIDEDSCLTYRNNIGAHIVCEDIAKIDSNDIPDADVVVGGFPCQGFSNANWQKVKNDPRNRMYIHFLRIVKSKNPKYFIAENVKGILSNNDGKTIKKIVKNFESIGYEVKYKLFNLADYGIPQIRQRVIIIGQKSGCPCFNFPEPTHCNPQKMNGHDLKPWITISESLNGIPEPKESSELKNHIYSKYKVTDRDFTGHRLTDPDKPSPTLLARGNAKGGVNVIQHYRNHRRMSIRECALIQTFPVDYEFSGSMTSCYRQIGNAVPVLFGKILGKELKRLERKLK